MTAKHQFLAVALVAALFGVASAALTSVFVQKSPTGGEQVQAVSRSDGPLEDLVASLQSENQVLQERVEALERNAIRPPSDGVRQPVGVVPPAGVDELRQEVAALTELIASPSGEAAPSFMEAVRTSIEAIEAQEEAERQQRRQDAEVQRLEDRLVDLAEKLSLAPYQVDELRLIYQNESARRDAMMTAARELDDWGNMRDTMREIRDETNNSLSQVLSADQMEKYEATNSNRGGRGGFGGGMGGGMGGGRGGGG